MPVWSKRQSCVVDLEMDMNTRVKPKFVKSDNMKNLKRNSMRWKSTVLNVTERSEDTESLKINPWTLYRGKGRNVYMPAMYQALSLTGDV